MAKKSKTQRAKASAARQARKNGEVQDLSTEQLAASDTAAKASKSEKQVAKPKKQRFQFFKHVIAELKRVTWPSKDDVLRWTLVVVVALTFFGILFAVLDNWVVSPVMIAISGLGA